MTAAVVANSKGSGGGISNSNDGTVNISNSVISDNVVKGGDPASSILRGGGVMNAGNGTINVTASVVHNNFVFGEGGGISNTSGNLNVSNSTIAQNRGNGGGVFGQGNFKSSIVAKNNGAPFAGSDVSGSFTSEGYNLIGVEDGSTGFVASTDLKGTVAAPLDPKFDPNGAEISVPAWTAPVPGLPLCGSPAIDKGTSNGLLTDLRGTGFPRVVDDPDESNASDGTDIGAFERQTVCAQIVFTVNTTSDADDASPTSNLLTRALADEDAQRETVSAFVDRDIPFTIATDGPEMMRTHLRDELQLLLDVGALGPEALHDVNARGHQAAFVSRTV